MKFRVQVLLLSFSLLAPIAAHAAVVVVGETYLNSFSLAQVFDNGMQFGPEVEQEEPNFVGGPRTVTSASTAIRGQSAASLNSSAQGGSFVSHGADGVTSVTANGLASATASLAGAANAYGGSTSSLTLAISALTETRSVWLSLDYDLTDATLRVIENGSFEEVFRAQGTTSGSHVFRLEPGSFYSLLVGATASYGLVSGTDTASYSINARIAPVPLPAAAWLLLSGFTMLVGAARRRARM